MKRLLIFVLLCASLPVLTAQPHVRHMAWTRLSVKSAISTEIELESELQYRRQSSQTANPLEEPMLSSLRFWLRYRANRHLDLIAVPFAWFHLAGASPDPRIFELNEEMRPALLLEYCTGSGKLKHRSRLGYEALLPVPGCATGSRARFRLKEFLEWRPVKRVGLNLGDELFLAPGIPGPSFNRLIAGISFSLSQGVDLEAGYLHQHLLPVSGQGTATAHAAFLNLVIHLHHESRSGENNRPAQRS